MYILQSEIALTWEAAASLPPSLPAQYTPLNALGQGTSRNVGSDVISQKRQLIPHNQSQYADSQVFGNRGLTLPLPQAVLWICSLCAPGNCLWMKPVDHLTVSGWLKQHFPVTLVHSTAELTPLCILFLYHVCPFFLPPLYIPFSWLHSSTLMCSFELPVHPFFPMWLYSFLWSSISMVRVNRAHSSSWLCHYTWEVTKWMTLVIGNMLCRPLS